MGMGDGGWKERSQSESGRVSGGSEWRPWVELPRRTSSMVSSAATVFRNIPCSAAAASASGAASAGSTAASAIIASHSRTIRDTVSVLKKCRRSRTASATGAASAPPVRLSCFLRILPTPM
ncbi:Os07g0614850 [Oryza sativa Japonica Group]|uniref:Os07g0614850 protein n=1 Tax=Oryza sativa subsp. japonica TaxID=39947 RepID=A0A0P0X8T4_ORYSJ|nr:hypothetical protein EE612_040661 [Oryza sativa]BAT02640.1 Os07g0614850 [Oryza sativa Japonica Group]